MSANDSRVLDALHITHDLCVEALGGPNAGMGIHDVRAVHRRCHVAAGHPDALGLAAAAVGRRPVSYGSVFLMSGRASKDALQGLTELLTMREDDRRESTGYVGVPAPRCPG